MAAFNPYLQNVSFYDTDGTTRIDIPIPAIDAFNNQTAIICLSYASQLGACASLLIVLLLLTPRPRLLRPSTLLHIAGLLIGFLRMVLLSLYFVSPFRHFFQFYASDFAHIPDRYYDQSNASTVASFALLLVAEAALMNQAWAMVRLWPRPAKWSVALLSAAIALAAVALKLVLTVIQVQAVLLARPAVQFIWLAQASLIVITLSVCWFCAVFNSKLVYHLLSNRGLLPSRRALSPMEVLVMANGILMIIPVIFTGLQWVQSPYFEAGSFALTSIILVLPLGSLAASRLAHVPQIDFNPSAATSFSRQPTSGPFHPFHPSSCPSSKIRSMTTTTVTASTIRSGGGGSYAGTSTTRVAGGSFARRSCEILDPLEVELRHVEDYEQQKQQQHPSFSFGRV